MHGRLGWDTTFVESHFSGVLIKNPPSIIIIITRKPKPIYLLPEVTTTSSLAIAFVTRTLSFSALQTPLSSHPQADPTSRRVIEESTHRAPPL